MNKIIKKVWLVFAFCIIAIALIFSLFRSLTPWVSQYKGQLETELTHILGEAVTIEQMETGWFWFEPVVKLNQIEIRQGLKQDLKIRQLIVGIDLWASIRQWRLQPGILLADGLHLDFNQKNDEWQVKGLQTSADTNKRLSLNSLPGIIRWVLNQQRIDFRDTNITIHLQGGTVIPLSVNRFSIENDQGRYKMQAAAVMKQTVPTKLQILATLNLDANDLRRSQGHIYFDFNHLLLTQWQSLIPKTRQYFQSGTARIQSWVDINSGNLSNVQGQLTLTNASLNNKLSDRHHFIQSLSANYAWMPTPSGWTLNSNQVDLKMHGETIANQALRLVYNQSSGAYNLTAPKLNFTLLRWFQGLIVNRPYSWLNNKLSGQLRDVDLGFTSKHISRFFTHFDINQLYDPVRHFGIRGLSGVIDGGKEKGQIKINSPRATVAFDNVQAITPINFMAEASWRRQGRHWLIEGISSNIQHKHLQLSQRGKLVIQNDGQPIYSDLETDFIVKDGEYWLAKLPEDILPGRLIKWLKKDIKHLGNVSGLIQLKGRLAQFPFIRGNGRFSVQTSLQDVEMAPVPGWPMAKDLNGTLFVNGRTLDASIFHGILGGIAVDRFKLRVDNLGLNKEIVQVHTQIDAQSRSIINYLLSTPLAPHLQPLTQIQSHGNIGLDLQIEVPLFDKDDAVYLVGAVSLNDNDIDIIHDGITFPLKGGRGQVYFNQQGLTYGELNGALWHQPMHIKLKSVHKKPEPYLQVDLDGVASTKEMSQVIPSPFWQFFHGQTNIQAKLIITENETDMDDFYISSNLKGVAIDLPPPFHKLANQSVATKTHLAFNPKIGFRKEVQMGDIVSANMNYILRSGAIELERGEIRLGGSSATLPQSKGVQVVGKISHFSLIPWQKVIAKFPHDAQSSEFAEKLKFVDLNIDRVQAFNQVYEHMVCKISQPDPGNWHVNLKQRDVLLDLHYDKKRHNLTGTIEKFAWKSEQNPSDSQAINIKPEDLPNLELTIKSFLFNQIPLGKLTITGTSAPNHWKLTEFSLESPFYHLFMNGNWRRQKQQHKTHLEGRAQLKNLGSLLKEWQKKPVVTARWGQIDFQLDSNTSLFDVTMASLKASIKTVFRHGIVTQLSKETEEKIGLGKLLSVLSLQTIPRRLQLDFSDLSNKGYSYDKFQGKFKLNHGQLSTKNSRIDGPVAFAAINGSINLIKQSYNVKLRIVPHITASLPVVATIAGGPIAGAVTWIVSKIITREMQRVTGYTYQIVGPWQHPEVEQLHIDKVKTNGQRKTG